MPDPTPEPLSASQVAELDARYVAFPSFAEWPRQIPREELWIGATEALASARVNATEPDFERARQIAMRIAAFDTGAIEGLYPTDRGLTFTVATQALAWQEDVAKRDPDALALFEAQLSALELILDFVSDHFPKITQAWIRRVHEVLTAAQATYVVRTPVGPQQQPLPKGEYKQYPNHVEAESGKIHAYAPVEQTPLEMERLVGELDEAAFRAAHPILQASYVHYALAAVHPFADGNGRVARAVASAYTYSAASVPLIILTHHRDRYFADLAAADAGDREPFVDFIARVARDGVEMVTESLLTARAPEPEAVLERLRELYVVQGDLSHQQIDDLVNRTVDELVNLATEKIGSLTLPDGVTIEVMPASGGQNSSPAPEGFREVVKSGSRRIQLGFNAPAPGEAHLDVVLDLFAATESDTAKTVAVRIGTADDGLILGLADLQPELSSSARFRAEALIERLLGSALDELLRQSEERLHAQGY